MDTDRTDKARHQLHSGELTQKIIGAFYEVYNTLGYGFLEAPYANALDLELRLRGMQVDREVPTDIHYKGHVVGRYRYDMLVNHEVIVEVKAQRALSVADEKQLLNYLKATEIKVGLLMNFGPEAKFVRKVH